MTPPLAGNLSLNRAVLLTFRFLWQWEKIRKTERSTLGFNERKKPKNTTSSLLYSPKKQYNNKTAIVLSLGQLMLNKLFLNCSLTVLWTSWVASSADRVPLIWWMYLDLKKQRIVYNISPGLEVFVRHKSGKPNTGFNHFSRYRLCATRESGVSG